MSTQKVGDKNGKRWSNENMENAMHDVIDKNMPLLWAANRVPKSTLHNRISGKVKHGDKPRPKLLLTAAEENKFAIFIVEVSQAGYGKTRKEMRQIAGSVTVDKGSRNKVMVSHGWLKRFLQRQSQLSR